MESQLSQEKRLIKARKRVDEIKGFYKHLAVYLIINLLLTFVVHFFDVTIRIIDGLELGNDIGIWFYNYPVWIIWGIILLIDAARVFVFPKVLGSDWQERKIREFMNEKNINE